jgi:hypothetical protein
VLSPWKQGFSQGLFNTCLCLWPELEFFLDAAVPHTASPINKMQASIFPQNTRLLLFTNQLLKPTAPLPYEIHNNLNVSLRSFRFGDSLCDTWHLDPKPRIQIFPHSFTYLPMLTNFIVMVLIYHASPISISPNGSKTEYFFRHFSVPCRHRQQTRGSSRQI